MSRGDVSVDRRMGVSDLPKTTTGSQAQAETPTHMYAAGEYKNKLENESAARSKAENRSTLAKVAFGIAGALLVCAVVSSGPFGGAALGLLAVGLTLLYSRHKILQKAGMETDTTKELRKGAAYFGALVIGIIVALDIASFWKGFMVSPDLFKVFAINFPGFGDDDNEKNAKMK